MVAQKPLDTNSKSTDTEQDTESTSSQPWLHQPETVCKQ